ncbi:MAG: type II secretion system protein [Candidatus Saccharimonadales bacterium]
MLKKTNNKGFTIIEVLIVLAIAGLIMLVVFLAVPALQRNSRNNGRQNDASRVAAAVSDWTANNQGKVFTAGTSDANLTAVSNSVGTLSQTTITATGSGQNFTVATGTQAALTTDAFRVVTGAQCGDNGATVADTSSNSRKTALQYTKEASGSTYVGQCINL